jgi:hypothetical protein
MLIKELEHLKCSCCKKVLTFVEGKEETEIYEDEEILHTTFFIISRKNCILEVNDGCIEIDDKNSNEKMNRYLCQSCFDDLLNGSDRLAKTFLYEGKRLY